MAARFSFPALAAAAALLVPAMAQDFEAYQQRQRDLVELSEIFGVLHHIRRNCEPRYEADIWRERMKTLLDLEDTEEAARETLVQAFNRGYRGAQQRYRACDRRARNFAASRAAEGDAIVSRLSEALRETEEEVYQSPYLASPADGAVIPQNE